MAADDFVVAITGASGSAYGIRLLEVPLRAGRNVHLTISLGRRGSDPARIGPQSAAGFFRSRRIAGRYG